VRGRGGSLLRASPAYLQLQRNLRHFRRVSHIPYGLSYRSRSTTITYYPRDWAISGLYAQPVAERETLRRALLNLSNTEEEADERLRDRFASEKLPCELRTLSDALRSESIERVDLLKIDVEKAELDVLAGIDDADWAPHPPARDGAASGLRAKDASGVERSGRAASTSRCARTRPWREPTSTWSTRCPASGGMPRISNRAGSVDP
jgi:FkbM family methyltransferase